MAGEKILIVDDEAVVRKLIQYHLGGEGYQVISAADGCSALNLVQTEKPQLVILDILLPDVDGIEICREIRRDNNMPVIFLTSKNDSSDVVLGLGVGGDDYIIKPFKPQEMLARVKAHLRRYLMPGTAGNASGQEKILRYPGLEINLTGRTVRVNGTPVNLTAKEFDLLALLARNPNRVFDHNQLLEQVWNYQNHADHRTLMVHINRLRKKIEPAPSAPTYILTVKGIGYKFNAINF